MAGGMKYPKDVRNAVVVNIGDETRTITDILSDLTITPYAGFWGVDEIMKTALGCGPQLAVVRTLESYPRIAQAQAYIEGFMAGKLNRKDPE